jgi:hypothetical protein
MMVARRPAAAGLPGMRPKAILPAELCREAAIQNRTERLQAAGRLVPTTKDSTVPSKDPTTGRTERRPH